MLKSMKSIFILTIILLLAGCTSQTGTENFDAQINLADEGQVMLAQADWAGYAALVHPQGLERFRAQIMPGIERMIIATDGDSVNLFGKNFHAQEFQSKTPAEFFDLIMTMVVEVSPDIKTTFANMTNKSLGGVMDADTMVHIVMKTHMDIGGRPVDEMNVQSVINVDGDWKLVMSPKIDGIAMMLAQAMMGR